MSLRAANLLLDASPARALELLSSGASYDLTQQTHRDALTNLFIRASAFGDTGSMEVLLRAGADLNAPAARVSARTPLIYALQNGDEADALRSATWLLERGASIALCSSAYGEFPLMIAAVRSGAALAELLIAHGAPINQQDSARGRNALHYAAWHNRLAPLLALLAAGADPAIRDHQNQSPSDLTTDPAIRAALLAYAERQTLTQTPPAESRASPRL